MVLEKLGEGGMAVVYAAYDRELDRKVALKILTSPGAGGESSEGQARLQREAQAMARLSHPNVVSVYDVLTVEGAVAIVLELVEGSTLRAWLRERSEPLEGGPPRVRCGGTRARRRA